MSLAAIYCKIEPNIAYSIDYYKQAWARRDTTQYLKPYNYTQKLRLILKNLDLYSKTYTYTQNLYLYSKTWMGGMEQLKLRPN